MRSTPGDQPLPRTLPSHAFSRRAVKFSQEGTGPRREVNRKERRSSTIYDSISPRTGTAGKGASAMTSMGIMNKLQCGSWVNRASCPPPATGGTSSRTSGPPGQCEHQPVAPAGRPLSEAGVTPDKLAELASRERLFRRQIAQAFRVPPHIMARRDQRLATYDQALPPGRRYGHHAGYEDPDWLSRAEAGLDDCANFLMMQAQFGSTDRDLEAEALRKISELTTLLERLRATRGAVRPASRLSSHEAKDSGGLLGSGAQSAC